MRTRNEKILLAILVAIVFGSLNFYGFQWLVKKQAALDLQAAELRADQAEAKVDLLQTDLWAQRKAWLQEHELALGEEGDTKAQVLQAILTGARDHKLEILAQSLSDSQHSAAGTSVNVAVKIKGPMNGICEWLADLQKPGNFYAVTHLVLYADQDQKSMTCDLQMARYFKGGQ